MWQCFVCSAELNPEHTLTVYESNPACLNHSIDELKAKHEEKILVFAIYVHERYPCICKTVEECLEAAGVDVTDPENLEDITIKPMLMTRHELANLPEHQGW